MKKLNTRLSILASLLFGSVLLANAGLSIAKPADATTQPTFISAHAIDLHQLLGNPPADDSDEHKAEIQMMYDWQIRRTPADVARCESEVASTPFTFAEVLGPWFTAQNLPATAALFEEVGSETRIEVNAAKKAWNRVRPFKADKRIQPCVVGETTPSYPSGHATRGMVWGNILAEILPQQCEKLLALGKRIGDDRMIAGMHYPSDVIAGQKLGSEIARQMLASPEMAAALEKAKAECQKMAQANAGK